jgi:DNA/RNA endonuclease YhcR with UshA esterase domain
MQRSTGRAVAALALFVMLSGCALALRTPSVAELKYNPGRYQNKTVAVTGVVTSSWGLPLVPFKLYKVDDGTGELTVVAQGGRTPTKGSRVRVKGRVTDVATFGGQSVGLHLEQRDLSFRR